MVFFPSFPPPLPRPVCRFAFVVLPPSRSHDVRERMMENEERIESWTRKEGAARRRQRTGRNNEQKKRGGELSPGRRLSSILSPVFVLSEGAYRPPAAHEQQRHEDPAGASGSEERNTRTKRGRKRERVIKRVLVFPFFGLDLHCLFFRFVSGSVFFFTKKKRHYPSVRLVV